MPVYNARRYLRPAAESILAQAFRDFELIFVDDGSTDDSLQILRKFESRDPRVRIITRPNTGIVGALNDGLAAARGEFIARMDSDDVATPDRFEKQVAFLHDHPDHVLVGSQVLLIDPEGEQLCPKSDTQYTHEAIDAAHLSHKWPLVHPTVMMRRSAVNAINGYRTKYEWLEDLDLFLRLAEVGKLASLSDVLLHYRLHPGSICHTREEDQDVIRPDLYKEVYERRGIAAPEGKANGRPDAARRLGEPGERDKLWGWWALIGGNVRTARKYAFRTVRAAPFTIDSWRLVFCALRGR